MRACIEGKPPPSAVERHAKDELLPAIECFGEQYPREILESIELGVKALAACPVKTDKRGEGQLEVPLRFAGVQMEPGHYLYADANGVVIAKRKLDVAF